MTPDEEERGWESVRARWSEEEAHRAWLAGFTDLEGLARAGQRYRDAVAADPADPVAARWRAEVVKRATVAGLASLPRTASAPPVPPWLKRWAIAGLSAVLAFAIYWAIEQLISAARSR